MAYSIGIWAVARDGGVVRYRWESDVGGGKQTGFVVLDQLAQVVRPSDETGQPIGSLAISAEGDATGQADVDRRQFSQVAAAILAQLKSTGSAPETAHRYFG